MRLTEQGRTATSVPIGSGRPGAFVESTPPRAADACRRLHPTAEKGS